MESQKFFMFLIIFLKKFYVKSIIFFITIRNFFLRTIYKFFLKPIFFLLDPEKVHDRMTNTGIFLSKYSFTKNIINFLYGYPKVKLKKFLGQNIRGIYFYNPIGLSAGFDKNALLTNILPNLSFGFEEVGSITGEYCEGNPKPRLFRLKKSKSLIVYYGLKNDGCEKVSERLKKVIEKNRKKYNKDFENPIGISIARTNDETTIETNRGIEDYFKAYKTFLDKNIGSYITINLSCPNTCGGEPFNTAKKLDLLLKKIFSIKKTKPIFLKLSPDSSFEELDKIFKVVEKYNIDGFVISNLTKDRMKVKNKIVEKNIVSYGGLSGKVVEELSNIMIAYTYYKTKGKYIIIGVGGIFSGRDAFKKILLGSSLLQLITGMIFEGPQLISDINLYLYKKVVKNNKNNISDFIGLEAENYLRKKGILK